MKIFNSITKNKRLLFLISTAILLIVSVLIFCSCSMPQKEVDTKSSGDSVELFDTTKVLSNEDVNNKFSEVADDYIISNDASSLSPNDVIVSAAVPKAPKGILRKVKSVNDQNGSYKIETENAALTDAIKTCHLSYTCPLNPDGSMVVHDNYSSDPDVGVIQKAYADGMDVELIKVEAKDKYNMFKADLSVVLNFDVDITDWKMDMLATVNFHAGIHNNQDLLKWNPKTKDPILLFKEPFTIMAGPVPIVFTVRADVGFEGLISLKCVNVDAGMAIDRTIGFRIKRNGDVESINEGWDEAPHFDVNPNLGKFKATASVTIPFSVRLLLFDCVGASMTVSPTAEANLNAFRTEDTNASGLIRVFPNFLFKGKASWKISLGFSGQVEMHFTKDLKFEKKLFDEKDALVLLEGDWQSEGYDTDPLFCPKEQISIVLDVSGSMNSGDKMDNLKKACTDFVNKRYNAQTQINLITFESEAEVVIDDATSKEELIASINNLKPLGATNMEDGLRKADLLAIDSDNVQKSIVLMSDGMPTAGLEGDELVDYAQGIKDKGIRIYAIGFYDDNMGEEQRLLQRIATKCYDYQAEVSNNLQDFFTDISGSMNGEYNMYVEIACPVDVSVSYGGETLSSSGMNVNSRTSFGSITYMEEEDSDAANRTTSSDDSSDSDSSSSSSSSSSSNSSSSSSSISSSANSNNSTNKYANKVKVLRLKEGPYYDITIKGNGTGKMNYSIAYCDINGDYTDYRYFDNIDINPKTIINTDASVNDTNYMTVDKNGDGKDVTTLKAHSNGGKGTVVREEETAEVEEPEDNLFFSILDMIIRPYAYLYRD